MMYECLTGEQREMIAAVAKDVVEEDAQHDTSYLVNIIKQWIEGMDVARQLEVISSEHEDRCRLLGFDPKTGREAG